MIGSRVRRFGLLAAGAVLAVALTACQAPVIGTTAKVTAGNANAHGVSDDGTWVLFHERPWGEVLGRLVLKNMSTLAKTNVTVPVDLSGGFLSRDGRFVTFSSWTDPATGASQRSKVYRWDRTTGVTSVVAAVTGYNLNLVAASSDGAYLGVDDGLRTKVMNASTKATVLVDPNAAVALCGMSDDGKTVLYNRDGIMRLRNLSTATTLRTWDTLPGGPPTHWPACGALSGDGKVVSFWGNSSALPGGPAPDYSTYLYSWSHAAGTKLISKAPVHAEDSALSATGRFLFFMDNGVAMRHDHATGKTNPINASSKVIWITPSSAGTAAALLIWVDPDFLVYRWKQ